MSNIVKTLAASASRTANGNGSAISIRGLTGLIAFVLDVTAQSGTTPTLDVDIQAYDPLSGKWSVIASFTQVGAATGTERITVTDIPEQEVRAAWTLGGTTPDYTFSVAALGKDK